MAEKSGKKKSKKAAKAETGVLGNLSATRPTRIGGDRRDAATPKPAATTKPKKAAPAKKPKVRTNAGTSPKPPVAPPAGWETPDRKGRKGGAASGAEIVTTAVQAAGEIAQVGVTVGSQLLKRAGRRLPRR